eukprot:CAMPEP_0196655618 /NCGR_PEP_ID=MMETSP1086-20130531/5373_1 /TAXON_ID=77921 /ORGANISM="Cyanoptyche  gloeocystis , Strain SAG4.97" /LENGTH=150 /DNA_ID=CAMNT_0041988029 /DNA_START=276 /DNA_END=728 /DNA_ORIENTATION=+
MRFTVATRDPFTVLMLNSSSVDDTQRSAVILSPSYKLPVGLGIIDIVLALNDGPLPLEGFILFLATFLYIQATKLRLKFTQESMELISRKEDTGSSVVVRSFPYQDWLNWVVFWPAFPLVFYWKETKSPHFMPMLFDPDELKACLKEHTE